MLLATFRVLSLALVLALAAGGCSPRAGEPAQAVAPEEEVAPAVTLIEDARLVCMVNNMYMASPQEPVQVEGKTYFGCCPACRDRLTTDASLRTARDPVTNEVVDKSRAVLARDDRNAILYFASADTMRQYRPAAR
jgi:hypothetical protein